jgi:hypothetical protein
MYYGEVRVSSEKLGSFLAAAEELQIKGLTNRKNAQIVSRKVGEATKVPRHHHSGKHWPYLFYIELAIPPFL